MDDDGGVGSIEVGLWVFGGGRFHRFGSTGSGYEIQPCLMALAMIVDDCSMRIRFSSVMMVRS
jgi:hypothetical protein